MVIEVKKELILSEHIILQICNNNDQNIIKTLNISFTQICETVKALLNNHSNNNLTKKLLSKFDFTNTEQKQELLEIIQQSSHSCAKKEMLEKCKKFTAKQVVDLFTEEKTILKNAFIVIKDKKREKAEKERLKREKIQKEKEEKARLKKEKAEKEKLKREELKKEKERLKKEKAEKERLKREKIQKEKEEKARLKKEKAEKKNKIEKEDKKIVDEDVEISYQSELQNESLSNITNDDLDVI